MDSNFFSMLILLILFLVLLDAIESGHILIIIGFLSVITGIVLPTLFDLSSYSYWLMLFQGIYVFVGIFCIAKSYFSGKEIMGGATK